MKRILLILLLPLILLGQENNYSLNFASTGDYVKLNNSVEVDDGYAISLWVEFPLPTTTCNEDNAHNVFAGCANQNIHFFSVNSNNILCVYSDATGWNCGDFNTQELDGWHQLGVISNGSNLTKFFVDNEVVDSVSFAVTGTFDLIGNYNTNYHGSCQPGGNLDEFKFWNYEINEEELLACDNEPYPLQFSFWNFEEGPLESQVIDVSGNGRHGVNTGATYLNPNNIICNDELEPSQNNNLNIDTQLGDLDCDGDVDMTDAQIVIQLFTGILDYNEYTQELDCVADNITGLMPEQLQEIINMLDEQVNNNDGNESSLNLWFPDGLHGNTIYFNNFNQSDYTVPEDSTLYIIRGRGNLTTNIEYPPLYHLTAENNETAPIIIPELTTISCDNDCGDSNSNIAFFVGRLVSKGVKVIARSDYTGNEIIVPEDSILIVTSHSPAALTAPGQSMIYFDPEPSNVIPLILSQGSIFQAGVFNGYLVDEDYFSLASSGSSSEGNSLNNSLSSLALSENDELFDIIDLQLDDNFTPQTMKIGPDNHIYVAGKFYDYYQDAAYIGDTEVFCNSNCPGMFISVYDDNGYLVGSITEDFTQFTISDIEIDNMGRIFVGGGKTGSNTYSNSMLFRVYNSIEDDIVYNASASTSSPDGINLTRVTDIEIDEDNGFVYITGYMSDEDGSVSELGIEPENGRVFLIKYDLNNFSIIDTKQFINSQHEPHPQITLDTNYNLWHMAGIFGDQSSGQPQYSFLISKFDSDFTLVDQQASNDVKSSINSLKIQSDSENNIFVAFGAGGESITFNNTTIDILGQSSTFLMKLNNDLSVDYGICLSGGGNSGPKSELLINNNSLFLDISKHYGFISNNQQYQTLELTTNDNLVLQLNSENGNFIKHHHITSSLSSINNSPNMILNSLSNTHLYTMYRKMGGFTHNEQYYGPSPYDYGFYIKKQSFE